jgi:GH43 family beta-xylosidase
MADPFVLRHAGMYYAYGTAPLADDGSAFPLLESSDLVHWRYVRHALSAVPDMSAYWAPEVAFHDGLFYMYYSAGHGDSQRLRVATSPTPTGPFTDMGRLLYPDEPFSIDPHPFRDADGTWYLYWSKDFLTVDANGRVGTGIVVDRMLDMMTPEGKPQLVVRPHADWHLFRASREMYGKIYDWHTIEGAATRLYNGRIYCFYSGGAWEHDNYGLSYVTAAHPLGPYTRPDLDGPILRSQPGVIGPGHNSFVESPDGTQTYCVYHGWDAAMTARLMRVDKLTWQGDTPVIEGPTVTPQPLP